MPNFFSDDEKCGNDLSDMPGAIFAGIKLGWMLACLFLMPLVILGRLFEGVARASSASTRSNGPNSRIPPHTEPPPWSPGQPPHLTPKADPLERFRLTLGVTPNANKDEIKSRFRYLSHLHHPDKVPEQHKAMASEDFKRIHEAYTVLQAVALDAPKTAKRPVTPMETARAERPGTKSTTTERPKQPGRESAPSSSKASSDPKKATVNFTVPPGYQPPKWPSTPIRPKYFG